MRNFWKSWRERNKPTDPVRMVFVGWQTAVFSFSNLTALVDYKGASFFALLVLERAVDSH
jgi:hypothetical protein